MGHFAVPELRRRTLWDALLRRSRSAKWHAVVDYAPPPIKTLCGYQSALDPHRTWDQTMPEDRCPRCERFTVAAEMAQSVMGAAEATEAIGPVKAELLRRRIMEPA
jgi:hypothetical protein